MRSNLKNVMKLPERVALAGRLIPKKYVSDWKKIQRSIRDKDSFKAVLSKLERNLEKMSRKEGVPNLKRLLENYMNQGSFRERALMVALLGKDPEKALKKLGFSNSVERSKSAAILETAMVAGGYIANFSVQYAKSLFFFALTHFLYSLFVKGNMFLFSLSKIPLFVKDKLVETYESTLEQVKKLFLFGKGFARTLYELFIWAFEGKSRALEVYSENREVDERTEAEIGSQLMEKRLQRMKRLTEEEKRRQLLKEKEKKPFDFLPMPQMELQKMASNKKLRMLKKASSKKQAKKGLKKLFQIYKMLPKDLLKKFKTLMKMAKGKGEAVTRSFLKLFKKFEAEFNLKGLTRKMSQFKASASNVMALLKSYASGGTEGVLKFFGIRNPMKTASVGMILGVVGGISLGTLGALACLYGMYRLIKYMVYDQSLFSFILFYPEMDGILNFLSANFFIFLQLIVDSVSTGIGALMSSDS